MNDLSKITRVEELPIEYKLYKIVTYKGDEFTITPRQRDAIMRTPDQFILLPNGDVLNKSAIEKIVLDKIKSKELFYKAHPELASPSEFLLTTPEQSKEGFDIIKAKGNLTRKLTM
jgi:uncharacterized protein YlzI (FlbEa/FlbD family)